MLWQDSIGGLEILNKNAEWIPAPPIEDTFVVNVGDWLQRVSNGRFVSTVHRVNKLTGDKPRYSMPFFFGLDYDAYREVRVVFSSQAYGFILGINAWHTGAPNLSISG